MATKKRTELTQLAVDAVNPAQWAKRAAELALSAAHAAEKGNRALAEKRMLMASAAGNIGHHLAKLELELAMLAHDEDADASFYNKRWKTDRALYNERRDAIEDAKRWLSTEGRLAAKKAEDEALKLDKRLNKKVPSFRK